MKSCIRNLVLAVCTLVLVTGCIGRELRKPTEGTRRSAYSAGLLLPSVACTDVGLSGGLGDCGSVEAVASTGVQFAGVDSVLPVQESSEPLRHEKALESIYFTFESAQLSEEARSALVRNYEVLSGLSRMKVRIEGNCDERGSDEYNLALGYKRARIAMEYLVSLGIAAERITTLSFGKEMAPQTDHDEASWSKSRRDDFIVVPY